MIKPIRPPYLLLSIIVFLILALLTGGAFWKIRRSPGFYEQRADKLAALGDHLMASRQYAAAAEKTTSVTERARLITKRCLELTKTDRSSLEEEFKDYFSARKTLLDTVKTNPGSSLPVEVALRFFYQWAEISPGGEAWQDLKELIDFIETTNTGGAALERFKAILRFRECLLNNTLDAETLSIAVEALEANQPPASTFDPDFHFNLNLARLYLAHALSKTLPGKAYSLRQQAVTGPPNLNDAAANPQAIANQAVLMLISKTLANVANDQSYAELEVRSLNMVGQTHSPAAQLSFAKQLLVSSLYPPLNNSGTEEMKAVRTAKNVLEDLIEAREQETLSTWMLLTFTSSNDFQARENALLATIRRRPDAEQGFLVRLVNFKLRIRAAQHRILQLVTQLENQQGRQPYDDMLQEAAEEVEFLDSLQLLRTGKREPQAASLGAIINRYNLEKRRGIVALRKADQQFKEENAFIKLHLGISLYDLGENGAALEQLEHAWALRQQLTIQDRLTVCDFICQALINTGQEKEAEKIIASLLAMDNPPGSVWTIAGRTFRSLSNLPAARISGSSDAYTAKAEAYLTRATIENPNDYRGWLELGLLHSQNGEFEQAEGHLQKALAREPRNWKVTRLSLQVLMARKRFPGALKLIEARLSEATNSQTEQQVRKLIAKAESDPQALLIAMDLLPPGRLAQQLALHDYYWQKHDQQANVILQELEKEAPNHERVVALNYQHLLKAKAHQRITRLLDNNQRPAVLKSLQDILNGEHALYFQHPYDAMNRFQEALKDDPWNSRTWILLSRAQEEGMLPEKAIESLQRAARVNPSTRESRRALNWMSREYEGVESIARILPPEAGQNPRGSGAWNALITDHRRSEQVEEIYSYREKVTPRDPMADWTLRQLAFIDLARGNVEKAEKSLRDLVDKGLASRQNRLALAMMLARTKNKQAASDYILQSFDNPAVECSAIDCFEIARVLNYLGANDAAGRFLAQAVKKDETYALDGRIRSAYIRWLLTNHEEEKAFTHALAWVGSQETPAVYTRIGNLFAATGLYRQSLDLLEKAPKTVGILGLVGGCRYALKDIKGARDAFNRAIRVAAKDPRPYIWLAKLVESTNNHASLREAEAAYKTAISLQPDLLFPRLELIRLMQNQERYTDARQELVALVGKWPNQENFRLWQCKNALSNNDVDAARTIINTAQELGMTSPLWEYLSARTAFFNNKPRQAIRQLLQATTGFTTVEPFEFLIEILIRESRFPEAETALDHVPEKMNSARLDVFRALLADYNNQPDACLEHVQLALTALESSPDKHARDWIRQILTTERISQVSKKLEDPRELLVLLQCAWDVGAYAHVADLANTVLRKIDLNDPNRTNIRLLLANACQLDGQYRRAAKVNEQIVKDMPGLHSPKNNLAYVHAVYLLNGEKAEALARAALVDGKLSEPTKLAYMDTLAMSFLSQKKYDEALNTLREASKVSDNAEINAHLALAILKNGQPVEGRRHLLEIWEKVASSETYSALTAEAVLETMGMAGIPVTSAQKLVLCNKHLKEKRFVRGRKIMRELPPISEDKDHILERATLLVNLRDLAAGRHLLSWVRNSETPLSVRRSLATIFSRTLPAESQAMYVYLEEQPSTPGNLLTDLGRRRLARKEYSRAEKVFARAVNSSTPSAEAVIGFLASRLRLNASPLPEAWLESMTAPLRESTGVKCLWAASGRDEETVDKLMRFVDKDPAIQASDILAAGYFLLNTEKPNYELLEGLATKSVEMNADASATWVFRAIVAEDSGKAEDAFDYFSQALHRDPFATTTISVIGLKLVLQNKIRDLEKIIDTYALLYQDKAWFMVLQGELARIQGNSKEAESAFREAFSLDNAPDTLFRLSQLLIDKEQTSEAYQLLLQNKAITQRSAPLLALWAKTSRITGDIEASLQLNAAALNMSGRRELNQVVEITAATCPMHALSRQFDIFTKQKVPAQRQELFIRQAVRNPETRQPDQLEKLFAESTPNSVARRVLGLLLTQALPAGSAAQNDLFNTLVATYPQSPLVFERFADHLLKQDDAALFDKANLAAITAVRLAEISTPPDDSKLADCLETLARSQIAMQLINPGYQSILRSVKLDPDVENLFLLAEILAQKGEWLQAEKELKRAEKLISPNGGLISPRDIERLRKRIENRIKESPLEP